MKTALKILLPFLLFCGSGFAAPVSNVPLGSVTITSTFRDTNWVLISTGTGTVRRITNPNFGSQLLNASTNIFGGIPAVGSIPVIQAGPNIPHWTNNLDVNNLSAGTIDGTNISFAYRTGAQSNQVLSLNTATNVVTTNLLTDVSSQWSTNAWTTDAAAANPTNWDVNMALGGQRLLMSTNVNITNVLGAASGVVRSKVLLIEGAANRTLRVPEWWHTADGSRHWYVTNYGILSIQTFGIIHTNAAFKNFY